MAISTEVFTQETLTPLEVIAVYKELMAASTGQDSLYIRAKETLEAYLEENNLTDREKAEVVSQMVGAMVTSITATTLQAAVDLAKAERNDPYILAKLREDTVLVQDNRNKVATEIAEMENDVNNKLYMGWKIQAELVRDFGVTTYNVAAGTEVVPEANFAAFGTKHEDVRLRQANVYNTYSSAYRSNGILTPSFDADGMLTIASAADANGLTIAQTNVAIRQEQGFDDNMRQHVANSSASMMSMLLSTEASGIDYAPYLAKWSTAIDYLNETVV